MVGTSNFTLYTRPKAVRAKRTQFGWSAGAPDREMRKTNPISEEVSSWKCQVLSRRSQRPGLQAFLLQTLHFKLHTAAQPPGRLCETNPIWPGRPGMGAGGRGREALPGSDCAKQSQFLPWQQEGQMLCGKGVQDKANFRDYNGKGQRALGKRAMVNREGLCSGEE